MLDFSVNPQCCTRCGKCIADCPARIIDMGEQTPIITAEKEPHCYRCQHCLAICPTGAISILGLKPGGSTPLFGNFPLPDKLETLIKGRRSIRHYQDENLDPALLQRLIGVASHAPSGMNMRQVRFTVVDDREILSRLRDQVYAGLGRIMRAGGFPAGLEFFSDFVTAWEERKIDVLFRGAPHLLITSAPKSCATPLPDSLIALSYFELFAQSLAVGTVWNGLAKLAIHDLLPETLKLLGIPDDHLIGYCMSFGKPAVRFSRTVQHTAQIHRVE